MPDDLSFRIGQGIAVTRDSPVYHLETDQLAGDSFGLLFFQGSPVGEVLPLHEFGNPSQSGLQRRSRIVDVVSIQAESHFQTEGITGTQTDRLDTEFRSGFENGVPYLQGILRIEIQFETTRTCIPCIRNDDLRNTGKFTYLESIIRYLGKVDRSQLLQGSQSLGSLNGQLTDMVG